jgi:4-carboxymuconolactone decarboxylase
VIDPRYAAALEKLEEMQGADTSREMSAQMEQVSPTFGEWAYSMSYGDVYCRPGLSLRDRQLVTIGVVATLGGCEAQLKRHMAVALNAGVTPEELVEVVIQLTTYGGAPRGSNAIRVAAEVMAERGGRLP